MRGVVTCHAGLKLVPMYIKYSASAAHLSQRVLIHLQAWSGLVMVLVHVTSTVAEQEGRSPRFVVLCPAGKRPHGHVNGYSHVL